MAFSAQEGKEFFRDWLTHFAKPLQFKRFLDVGCGAGTYGKIIQEVFVLESLKGEIKIHAIEAFEPYIERHGLKRIYDDIAVTDIMDVGSSDVEDYDLIICGDVLEHLSLDDAADVVACLSTKCRFLWGALPLKVEGRSWSAG